VRFLDSGASFTRSQISSIVVPEFPIPDHWERAYGLVVRWHTAAVICGARDPNSDVLYLDGEYWGEADPAVHVAAIRARGEWIPGLIDLFDNGRDRLDGIRLMEIYGGLGLHLQQVDNSLESGILQVSQRMRSGRLKVFPSLTKYLEERRLYRRDGKRSASPPAGRRIEYPVTWRGRSSRINELR